MIFSISIPLLNNAPFDIFKLHPLPMKVNNFYSYIQPDFEILIYSEMKDLYSHMDNLNSCLQIRRTSYICQMENPLTNVHIEPICETEIINAISEFPKSCKALSVKHNKEIWHQLVNRNKWIYLANCQVTIKGIQEPILTLLSN